MHTPIYLPPEKEDLLRQLYALACKAGEAAIPAGESLMATLNDKARRAAFVRASHAGFMEAQCAVLSRCEELSASSEPVARRELQFLRKVMDAIAWQILGNQLYIARRLFRTQPQMSLASSNIPSLKQAVTDICGPEMARFALLSDLTTFVQVGDLIVAGPDIGQWQIVEVKEGKVNERLSSLVSEHGGPERDQAIATELQQSDGKATAKQFLRMRRQTLRMQHVVDVANLGNSTDPDSGAHVHVPEDPVEVDYFDPQLDSLLHVPGGDWQVSVVDGCLFLGVYRGPMRHIGRAAHNIWMQGCGAHDSCPRADLMHSLSIPLALPVFNRRLSVDHKFDVLMGRSVVRMGIHVDNFVLLANAKGVPVRWSTRKEAASINRSLRPISRDGKNLVTDTPDGVMTITDGNFLKIFFHGMTPSSVITMLGTSSARK